MALVDVNTQEFEEKTSEGLKLVDLWAPWCGSCKMINPSVESIADEYKDNLEVLKVDIDEEPDIASGLDVMSIPTLILFKDGKRLDSLTGFQPKEKIQQLIEDHK